MTDIHSLGEENNLENANNARNNPDRCKTISIATNDSISKNDDINLENRSSSQAYNVPYIKMDEMLQDHNIAIAHNARLMNTYYNNLSIMGNSKPFFFPPADLGMVESMGSFENSSKFFKSVMSTKMNQSIGKNGSIIAVSMKSKQESSAHTSEDEIPLKNQITENNNNASEEKDSMNDVSVESIKTADENLLEAAKSNHEASQQSSDHIKISETANIDLISKEPERPMVDRMNSSTSPMKPAEVDNADNLSVESYYILEDLTKEGLQKYLKDAML